MKLQLFHERYYFIATLTIKNTQQQNTYKTLRVSFNRYNLQHEMMLLISKRPNSATVVQKLAQKVIFLLTALLVISLLLKIKRKDKNLSSTTRKIFFQKVIPMWHIATWVLLFQRVHRTFQS